jgi:hypothetical protein
MGYERGKAQEFNRYFPIMFRKMKKDLLSPFERLSNLLGVNSGVKMKGRSN